MGLIGEMHEKEMEVRTKLISGLEAIADKALRDNGITILNMEKAVWQIHNDRRKVLVYDGEPLLDIFPLEIQQIERSSGHTMSLSHKYRILRGKQPQETA